MMELFEAGYTVTCGTTYGDRVMETREDVEEYMEDDFQLDEVDHEAKTAYFFYDVFADEDEWGEDL
jgi:hypothetical protein